MIRNAAARTDIKMLPKSRRLELDRLVKTSGQIVDLAVNPKTKKISWFQGSFNVAGRLTKPDKIALRFLAQNAALFGIPADLKCLDKGQIERTGDGTRVYFRQIVGGFPVFGAGVIADVASKTQVRAVGINLARISRVPLRGKVKHAEAAQHVFTALGIKHSLPLKGELVIADLGGLTASPQRPILAWSFVLEATSGAQQVLLDTRDGRVMLNAGLATAASGRVVTALNPLPRYHLNAGTNAPTFISFAPTGLALPKITSSDPEQIARDFFATYPRWFGTGAPERRLKLIKKQIKFLQTGTAHITFQQLFGGVPVFGAYLKVHLKESTEITSISGNYVRWPGVVPVPKISKTKALQESAVNLTAFRLGSHNTIGFNSRLNRVRQAEKNPAKDPKAAALLGKAQGQASEPDLVILPAALLGGQASKNHLAWRIRFPEADLFISALSGRPVFALSNRCFVQRKIYDAFGQPDILPGLLVIEDGQAVPPGRNPGNEARRADNDLRTTIAWYEALGHDSYDDRESDVVLVVNADIPNTQNNAYWDKQRSALWFETGMALDDVLAHEFTHGVTDYTANFVYLDEPGALMEHYADVLGNLCFPDATAGQWLQGETAAGGAMRDLADPAVFGDPVHYADFRWRGAGCAGVLDPLTGVCDNGNVHTNCGIGNRAAVLLCDGSWPPAGVTPATTTPPTTPGHTGIGRNRLTDLFYHTLTTHMHPWSTYMDELLNTWQTALEIFDIDVAQEVLWAFGQAGIDPRLVSGLYEVHGHGRGTFPMDLGDLPVNMQVTAVTLIVTAYDPLGYPIWSGAASSSATDLHPRVDFPGGAFGAGIDDFGFHTQDLRVTIGWYDQGFDSNWSYGIVFHYEDIATGTAQPPLPEYISTPFQNHEPDSLGNNDGFDILNEGDTLTGTNCQITQVTLDLLDNDNHVIARHRRGDPGVEAPRRHRWSSSYGARIEEDGAGTDNMRVRVRWWLEPPCACRYRILYEFTGQGCHQSG